MQGSTALGNHIGRNCEVRESFSPDLVLQQRRMQENQQNIQTDGITSARFKFEEEEDSVRKKVKRVKPQAIDVSEDIGGCESNLNSQRNFINSQRTIQSGLSSRRGNSSSSKGEIFSNTVVKDKDLETEQINEGEIERDFSSIVKRNNNGNQMNLREEQIDKKIQSQEVMHQHNIEEGFDSGDQMINTNEQLDNLQAIQFEQQQYQRNVATWDQKNMQQVNKVIRQPSLLKSYSNNIHNQQNQIVRSTDGNILSKIGQGDLYRSGFSDRNDQKPNKNLNQSLQSMNRSYQCHQRMASRSLQDNPQGNYNEFDFSHEHRLQSQNQLGRNRNSRELNNSKIHDNFNRDEEEEEDDLQYHQMVSNSIGTGCVFTEGEIQQRSDTLETLMTRDGFDLRSLQPTEENENILQLFDLPHQSQRLISEHFMQDDKLLDLNLSQTDSRGHSIRQYNSRLNSSMGQLNKSIKVDQLIHSSGCRSIKINQKDDFDKENIREFDNSTNKSGGSHKNIKDFNYNKNNSSMKINQVELENVYSSLLIQERREKEILEQSLLQKEQQTLDQENMICQLQQQLREVKEQNQIQFSNAEQHLLEVGEQLDILTEKLNEAEHVKVELLEENKLLMDQKNSLLNQNKNLEQQLAASKSKNCEKCSGKNDQQTRIQSIQQQQQQQQQQQLHQQQQNERNILGFKSSSLNQRSNQYQNNIKRQREDSSHENVNNILQTEDDNVSNSQSMILGVLKSNTGSSFYNHNNNNDSKNSNPNKSIISNNQHLNTSGYSVYSQNVQVQVNNKQFDYEEMKKFILCVMGMIEQCAPHGYFTIDQPNSIKRSWKFLKQMIGKYIELKQRVFKDQEYLVLLEKIADELHVQTIEEVPKAIKKILYQQYEQKLQNNSHQNHKKNSSLSSIPSTFIFPNCNELPPHHQFDDRAVPDFTFKQLDQFIVKKEINYLNSNEENNKIKSFKKQNQYEDLKYKNSQRINNEGYSNNHQFPNTQPQQQLSQQSLNHKSKLQLEEERQLHNLYSVYSNNSSSLNNKINKRPSAQNSSSQSFHNIRHLDNCGVENDKSPKFEKGMKSFQHTSNSQSPFQHNHQSSASASPLARPPIGKSLVIKFPPKQS